LKYAEALSEAEVLKINAKSVKDWIEKNKANIKAKPNKTLLYSGRDFDLEQPVNKLKGEDRRAFQGTQM
jgi:hypothetical protein